MNKDEITILINEDLDQMMLGLNSSLLYILLAFDYFKNVNVIRIDQNQNFPHGNFDYYQIDQKVARHALQEYQIINQNIRINDLQLAQDFTIPLGNWLKKNTLELFKKNVEKISSLNLQSHFILNRVEPMKAPFPPQGKHDIQKFFKDLIELFPSIHAPFQLYDKEIIADLSIPSEIYNSNFNELHADQFCQKILLTIDKYQQLYPNSLNPKIVIKPLESAQSLGVFSIEFTNHPQAIKTCINYNSLLKQQQYLIDRSIIQQPIQLNKIIKKLCELQNIGKPITDLYGSKIIIQPFLEGILIGDFRAIILKNQEQKFYLAGNIFRKKINFNQAKTFTTCASSGQSIACSSLKFDQDLKPLTSKIINYLNQNQQKYHHIKFIGADLIALNKNCKEFFLAELNFSCPALISMLGKKFEDVKSLELFVGQKKYSPKSI